MRIWVLGSGSRGNAILLDGGETRVLIDAGFSPRAMAARMKLCGIAPESVQAVLVTHEHTDHVRGAAAASERWGWSIHTSTGTARNCRSLELLPVKCFVTGATITIGTLSLKTTRVSHDAADPVAVIATCTRTGVRAAIAHDLGYVDETLARELDRVDVLVLESNHCSDMLRAGPYPPIVQARIASRSGHLSNGDACAAARRVVHKNSAELVLAHISKHNNTPATALSRMREALRGTRFSGRLTAAEQDAPCGPFGPAKGGCGEPQLALDFDAPRGVPAAS
jgi:phosphoribosyl 1,2-cyclic phosphodiesterase